MAEGWVFQGQCRVRVARAAGTDPTLSVSAVWSFYAYGSAEVSSSMFDGSFRSTGSVLAFGSPYFQNHTIPANGNPGSIDLGTTTVQPGVYSVILQESSPYASSWEVWSKTLNLSEGGMDGGGEDPPGDSDDRSWFSKQFELSSDVEEDWVAMVDQWKHVGPWGELQRIQAPAAQTPIGELPAMHLVLPRQRDPVTGNHVGPVIESGDFQLMPLTYTFAQGTSGALGDAQAPWGAADSLGGWRTAVRTIIGFAAWAFVLIGFVGWLKGRVSV